MLSKPEAKDFIMPPIGAVLLIGSLAILAAAGGFFALMFWMLG